MIDIIPKTHCRMLVALRGGGGVQPKFFGKLGLEIGVFQKAPPIGGSFVEVSESLHLLRSA